MTRAPDSGLDILTALDQRLTETGRVLIDGDAHFADSDRPGVPAGHLLPLLIALCADPRRQDARWLLLTAVFGAFPTGDQLRAFGRQVELDNVEDLGIALLAQVIREPGRGRVDLPMTIVVAGTLLDVDFCARYDTHTGIHRVVRETMPRWNSEHPVTAVAWIDAKSAYRTLAPREAHRVFAHDEPQQRDLAAAEEAFRPTLVVPWRSTLVLADVPNPGASDQLAALATYSGNTLSIIGYDMIPITSAEMRPPADAVAFAQYLTVVKHAHRVAGISRSAAAEFAGFTGALAAQGLPGPVVREVLLAGEAPRAARTTTRSRGQRPVMLCVGSHEPHKNQRAALQAAERLWREGLDFEVRLVGGPGWSDAVLRPALDRLVRAGRPVTSVGRVSDAELIDEMARADFVFFASLHEGYGLPVAEALACGTPVITSNFGSQLEIAELGGCLVVDPRDDDDITRAIRSLLTSPNELERLRTEAAARPVRTWDTYASELWAFLGATGDVA